MSSSSKEPELGETQTLQGEILWMTPQRVLSLGRLKRFHREEQEGHIVRELSQRSPP